ncbi:MAG: hypothetical protein M3Y12_05185 [Bacteroidota bacterium]|nr:hypothetical protein [Bacteroidota bacterium]
MSHHLLAIDEAIAELVSLGGTKERKDAIINSKYGADTLTLATEIYEFAVNYPVDWTTMKLDEALLETVRAAVKHRYPFLDAQTVRQLASYFAYLWK